MILNTELKKARKEKDFKQTELAIMCGIALRTYKYYESGERVPDVYTAQMMAKVLNKRVEDLFGIVPDTTIISCY